MPCAGVTARNGGNACPWASRMVALRLKFNFDAMCSPPLAHVQGGKIRQLQEKSDSAAAICKAALVQCWFNCAE